MIYKCRKRHFQTPVLSLLLVIYIRFLQYPSSHSSFPINTHMQAHTHTHTHTHTHIHTHKKNPNKTKNPNKNHKRLLTARDVVGVDRVIGQKWCCGPDGLWATFWHHHLVVWTLHQRWLGWHWWTHNGLYIHQHFQYIYCHICATLLCPEHVACMDLICFKNIDYTVYITMVQLSDILFLLDAATAM